MFRAILLLIETEVTSGRNLMIVVIADKSRIEQSGCMKISALAIKHSELRMSATIFRWIAAFSCWVLAQISANAAPAEIVDRTKPGSLKPIAPIPVAFVISDGAVIIDFCGPWEVFRDVMVGNDHPFRLYTVSDKTAPIQAGGGMKIVPDYTFSNAPAPKVIVIPAQSEPSKAMLDWIRESSKNTDVTMSVCTGAFVLAKTGLLDSKSATTFHAAFNTFARQFPNITLKRGARFVENGNLATAGGLSSGIDLALRVVERYYGSEVAANTAYNMEYQGQGWTNPESNQVYAVTRVSTDEHPLCPVCTMEVDPKTSPKSVFKGKAYYFCSDDDKKLFDAAPDKFVPAQDGKIQ
jgi:transcriptional regulator GlxA family with amidase domain